MCNCETFTGLAPWRDITSRRNRNQHVFGDCNDTDWVFLSHPWVMPCQLCGTCHLNIAQIYIYNYATPWQKCFVDGQRLIYSHQPFKKYASMFHPAPECLCIYSNCVIKHMLKVGNASDSKVHRQQVSAPGSLHSVTTHSSLCMWQTHF